MHNNEFRLFIIRDFSIINVTIPSAMSQHDDLESTATEQKEIDNIDDLYEEVLVYVDFPDFDECNFLMDGKTLELGNVFGEQPTCKIGDLNFTGNHELNLGTQLFFESDESSTACVGRSDRIINFKLSSIDTAEG